MSIHLSMLWTFTLLISNRNFSVISVFLCFIICPMRDMTSWPEMVVRLSIETMTGILSINGLECTDLKIFTTVRIQRHSTFASSKCKWWTALFCQSTKSLLYVTLYEPPLGFAFATSRSCRVTSCTTSLRLCTSPCEDNGGAYAARLSIAWICAGPWLYLRQGHILLSFQVVLCRVSTLVLRNAFPLVLASVLAV